MARTSVTVVSAFSLNMIPAGADVEVKPLDAQGFRGLLIEEAWIRDDNGDDALVSRLRPVTFSVGHEGTARELSRLLGMEIPCKRDTLSFAPVAGEVTILIVAQPCGQRLVPGTEISVPDLKFFRVDLRPRGEAQANRDILFRAETESMEAEEDRQAEDGAEVASLPCGHSFPHPTDEDKQSLMFGLCPICKK